MRFIAVKRMKLNLFKDKDEKMMWSMDDEIIDDTCATVTFTFVN